MSNPNHNYPSSRYSSQYPHNYYAQENYYSHGDAAPTPSAPGYPNYYTASSHNYYGHGQPPSTYPNYYNRPENYYNQTPTSLNAGHQPYKPTPYPAPPNSILPAPPLFNTRRKSIDSMDIESNSSIKSIENVVTQLESPQLTQKKSFNLNKKLPSVSNPFIYNSSTIKHTVDTINSKPEEKILIEKNENEKNLISDCSFDKVRIAFNMDHYERGVQCGEGTYGKVYKAKHKLTGRIVALKKVLVDTSSSKEGFPITSIREIRILNATRHKNIIQLMEIISIKDKDSPSIQMVFEYMDHDLTGILANNDLKLEPQHIKCLLKQMFEGLDFLHSKGIIHRDMKGSNLLLNSKGELKLADFGLARNLFNGSGCGIQKKIDFTNRVITLWYRSPELLLGATNYKFEIDIWSTGCIFLELFDGDAPFRGTNEIEQLDKIFRICGVPTKTNWPEHTQLPWWQMMKPKHLHNRIIRSSYSKKLSPYALDLLDHLLQLDPKQRLTCKQILEHELPKIEGDWHEYESKQRRRIERTSSQQEQHAGDSISHSRRESFEPSANSRRESFEPSANSRRESFEPSANSRKTSFEHNSNSRRGSYDETLTSDNNATFQIPSLGRVASQSYVKSTFLQQNPQFQKPLHLQKPPPPPPPRNPPPPPPPLTGAKRRFEMVGREDIQNQKMMDQELVKKYSAATYCKYITAASCQFGEKCKYKHYRELKAEEKVSMKPGDEAFSTKKAQKDKSVTLLENSKINEVSRSKDFDEKLTKLLSSSEKGADLHEKIALTPTKKPIGRNSLPFSKYSRRESPSTDSLSSSCTSDSSPASRGRKRSYRSSSSSGRSSSRSTSRQRRSGYYRRSTTTLFRRSRSRSPPDSRYRRDYDHGRDRVRDRYGSSRDIYPRPRSRDRYSQISYLDTRDRYPESRRENKDWKTIPRRERSPVTSSRGRSPPRYRSEYSNSRSDYDRDRRSRKKSDSPPSKRERSSVKNENGDYDQKIKIEEKVSARNDGKDSTYDSKIDDVANKSFKEREIFPDVKLAALSNSNKSESSEFAIKYEIPESNKHALDFDMEKQITSKSVRHGESEASKNDKPGSKDSSTLSAGQKTFEMDLVDSKVIVDSNSLKKSVSKELKEKTSEDNHLAVIDEDEEIIEEIGGNVVPLYAAEKYHSEREDIPSNNNITVSAASHFEYSNEMKKHAFILVSSDDEEEIIEEEVGGEIIPLLKENDSNCLLSNKQQMSHAKSDLEFDNITIRKENIINTHNEFVKIKVCQGNLFQNNKRHLLFP
ncbi:kinase subunit of RNA polymerase II carboxy-terminal domain kinase I [Clydaea vesicula]|uniref:cyclin-dependent kinase n=1 Tax=Clydaea vesicula TaxID=447962 RepID=A0AAD5U597_9FUNG|nr:kinase subunit of RNA polymerase II carboxy-terminal domain kinase I [Clydaea vesicula]